MINVFQPCLGEEEATAVAEVFASNWTGRGPRTKDFEAEFAAHLEVPPEQVVFINSCTAGLFLAAALLELGPGDDVVLPSVSFVAAANAVAATGARPVFCDSDVRTLNPTAAHVEQALTPRTKAVVVLHYGGYPGDIAAIAQVCRRRGITLVEDAACSVASRVDGVACGTFGDLATWSFDSMKVLVTGDGGAFYARDPDLAKKARELAYHGLENASAYEASRVSDRWWEPSVRAFGHRFIGNDTTAAIGLVQLRKLSGFVARRRDIAALYDQFLADVEGVRLPPPLPHGHASSYYFYWVQFDADIRDRVAKDLLDHDIFTTFRYPALHRIPAYASEGLSLPGAEAAADRTLLLPLHPGLSNAEVSTVIDALRRSVEGIRAPGRGPVTSPAETAR
ncbi:DegT/DnrJ/EryC1/StrS family aminotransferase [Streptomyces lancefieldiae]|uniref:DegT/DnrJ/EryC1/StrS family aminotransferase n=1 Tax=Streptomyces lancefieldiae TaxID=3075520 RepID=A0ABU3B0I7_9ACTN|nr:DegT/DnrJ/EryC1/StrS family aminotransferase [Streptomyces sp. DSM 40712]MDT0615954.1 DegT/DnrJ/EryC1/StrS family aminotransferase [Streptomyces sp. DSM 40712]